MLRLKEQVFGDKGYSSDLKLGAEELDVFRQAVNSHWLSTLHQFYPELLDEAEQLSIEGYHQLAPRLDHRTLWPKRNRVLPTQAVTTIKSLPFIQTLRQEFGEFAISDVYDTQQHYGQEEIYWRLVRPREASDVGSLHKDNWFHGAFNEGYGMFSEDTITVKVWIPLYCEPGKSGLMIAAGSHLKEHQYRIDTVDGVPRPHLEEDPTTVGAALIPTDPGTLLIFNEAILHGGAVNQSDKTRVSAEITMVINRTQVHQ